MMQYKSPMFSHPFEREKGTLLVSYLWRYNYNMKHVLTPVAWGIGNINAKQRMLHNLFYILRHILKTTTPQDVVFLESSKTQFAIIRYQKTTFI